MQNRVLALVYVDYDNEIDYTCWHCESWWQGHVVTTSQPCITPSGQAMECCALTYAACLRLNHAATHRDCKAALAPNRALPTHMTLRHASAAQWTRLSLV